MNCGESPFVAEHIAFLLLRYVACILCECRAVKVLRVVEHTHVTHFDVARTGLLGFIGILGGVFWNA